MARTYFSIYGLPICSLIFWNFFANIPDELVEAARIDGAGVVRTFWLVMLPLALPAFVVVGIFQFTDGVPGVAAKYIVVRHT